MVVKEESVQSRVLLTIVTDINCPSKYDRKSHAFEFPYSCKRDGENLLQNHSGILLISRKSLSEEIIPHQNSVSNKSRFVKLSSTQPFLHNCNFHETVIPHHTSN